MKRLNADEQWLLENESSASINSVSMTISDLLQSSTVEELSSTVWGASF